MRLRNAILLGLLLALVAIALGLGWVIRFRPLATFAFSSRLALRSAGLEKVAVASPAGRQIVFHGGKGPVLVLLHGAGDQAGTWFRVAPPLAAHYTLIVPDLAGHGDSAPAAGPIDVGSVLAGVEATLDALAPEQQVTIAGNSLGAWIAMLVAHRHPERVARVVCINGGALRGGGDHAAVLPKSRAEATASMALVRDAGSAPIPGYVLDDVVRQAASGPLARLAATAAGMESWLLDGKLGEVRPPVTLLWGVSDRLMPIEYAEAMAAGLGDAKIVRLERCGHVPQLECSDRLLAALLDAAAPPPEGEHAAR